MKVKVHTSKIVSFVFEHNPQPVVEPEGAQHEENEELNQTRVERASREVCASASAPQSDHSQAEHQQLEAKVHHHRLTL